ncbi:helix-turn-helix domain-containing protein [Bacillus velezensis]|nr:LysR family transcriptional regulator [Bacillus velezensis]
MCKVAEELKIVERCSSVSIKRVENEVGRTLFERKGRNIKVS